MARNRVADRLMPAASTAVLPALFKKRDIQVKGAADFQYWAFDLSLQVSQLGQFGPDIIGVGAPRRRARQRRARILEELGTFPFGLTGPE